MLADDRNRAEWLHLRGRPISGFHASVVGLSHEQIVLADGSGACLPASIGCDDVSRAVVILQLDLAQGHRLRSVVFPSGESHVPGIPAVTESELNLVAARAQGGGDVVGLILE